MFSRLLQSGLRFFSTAPKKPIITFTEDALEQLRTAIKLDRVLSVNVKSGGCAGLRLSIEHIKDVTASDVNISQGYVDVYTNSNTAKMLEGAVIDFENSLLKNEFVITHPAIKSRCGCNESFLYDFDSLKPKS